MSKEKQYGSGDTPATTVEVNSPEEFLKVVRKILGLDGNKYTQRIEQAFVATGLESPRSLAPSYLGLEAMSRTMDIAHALSESEVVRTLFTELDALTIRRIIQEMQNGDLEAANWIPLAVLMESFAVGWALAELTAEGAFTGTRKQTVDISTGAKVAGVE